MCIVIFKDGGNYLSLTTAHFAEPTFCKNSMVSPHALLWQNLRNRCAVVGLCNTIWKTSGLKKSAMLLLLGVFKVLSLLLLPDSLSLVNVNFTCSLSARFFVRRSSYTTCVFVREPDAALSLRKFLDGDN
jgi:hypothetical protein